MDYVDLWQADSLEAAKELLDKTKAMRVGPVKRTKKYEGYAIYCYSCVNSLCEVRGRLVFEGNKWHFMQHGEHDETCEAFEKRGLTKLVESKLRMVYHGGKKTLKKMKDQILLMKANGVWSEEVPTDNQIHNKLRIFKKEELGDVSLKIMIHLWPPPQN